MKSFYVFLILSVTLLQLISADIDVPFKVGQQELILNCSVGTDQVDWFKNDTLVVAKENVIEILPIDGGSQLKFYKSKFNDLGLYSCKSRVTDNQEIIRVTMEPIVVGFTKSASVVEGDKLRQPCTVNGFPVPTVRWMKEDDAGFTELEAGSHFEFEPYDGVSDATLVINEATDADRGSYVCEARNELGSSNSTVLVRVIDKYAALWPFVGILVEVVVLCSVILIFEKRRTKKLQEDSDNEQHNS